MSGVTESQLKSAIIDLYQNIKIRKKTDTQKIDETFLQQEKISLQSISPLVLIDYMKTHLSLLIDLKVSEKLSKQKTNPSEFYSTYGSETPSNEYEKLLRRYESDIRNYIKIENMLKIHIDELNYKLELLQKQIEMLQKQSMNFVETTSSLEYKKKIEELTTLVNNYEKYNLKIPLLEKKIKIQKIELDKLDNYYKKQIKNYSKKIEEYEKYEKNILLINKTNIKEHFFKSNFKNKINNDNINSCNNNISGHNSSYCNNNQLTSIPDCKMKSFINNPLSPPKNIPNNELVSSRYNNDEDEDNDDLNNFNDKFFTRFNLINNNNIKNNNNININNTNSNANISTNTNSNSNININSNNIININNNNNNFNIRNSKNNTNYNNIINTNTNLLKEENSSININSNNTIISSPKFAKKVKSIEQYYDSIETELELDSCNYNNYNNNLTKCNKTLNVAATTATNFRKKRFMKMKMKVNVTSGSSIHNNTINNSNNNTINTNSNNNNNNRYYNFTNNNNSMINNNKKTYTNSCISFAKNNNSNCNINNNYSRHSLSKCQTRSNSKKNFHKTNSNKNILKIPRAIPDQINTSKYTCSKGKKNISDAKINKCFSFKQISNKVKLKTNSNITSNLNNLNTIINNNQIDNNIDNFNKTFVKIPCINNINIYTNSNVNNDDDTNQKNIVKNFILNKINNTTFLNGKTPIPIKKINNTNNQNRSKSKNNIG